MEVEKKEAKECRCPYCDEKMDSASPPFCSPCQVTVLYCAKCKKPVPATLKKCPDCGAEIAG